MKRNNWLKGSKKPPVVPFVTWQQGSPDLWTLSVVYDMGPTEIFEDTGITYNNAVGLDGYPTSYTNYYDVLQARDNGRIREVPELKHKAAELYKIAKARCKKLKYNVSKMP